MHRKFAFGSVGGEHVVVDHIAFEVRDDVVLHLLVVGTADGARAEGNDFFHVLHGAIAVECRWRASVRREGEWGLRLGSLGGLSLPVVMGGVFAVVAGEERTPRGDQPNGQP